ncbi:MAG: glycosyltransferase family 2 protein [Bacteroidales bacterium]|nr:glycosyltransferase family 2 protein [Bacteroidales bacterium]MBD5205152.1 glycosyltransferase family 2 protein [Bacteroidales bacterium]
MTTTNDKSAKDVAVSIVTHGTDVEELKKAVDCIIRCPRIINVDILDNSDPDLSEEYRTVFNRPGYENIKVTHIPNHGYGAGHNVSILKSLERNIRYHLVMNSDISWNGDVISTLCDQLDNREEIAQIMPKVYYPDGVLQLTARRLPTPWDVFAKRFLPDFIVRRRVKRYLLHDVNHEKEINSPYLLGSFMLFRTSALRETGVFDERFFMYPEDIDITRRLHRHYVTLYYPSESIIHEHRAASRKSLRMLRIHIENMIRYFNKWGWFFDSERREMNLKLDSTVEKLKPEDIPESRG